MKRIRAWWRRLSLHAQLVIASALVLAVTLLVTTLWSVRQQRAQLFEDHRAQIVSLARMAALASRYLVISARLDELEALLLRLALMPDIDAIMVTDAQGRVLSSVRLEDGEPRADFSVLHVTTPGNQGARELRFEDRLEVWYPIETSTRLGWVRVHSDLQHLESLAAGILRDNLLATGVAIALDLMILLVILWSPGRSFRRAVRFAQELIHTPGQRLELEGGSQEVAELIEALNASSRDLAERERAISRLNRQLEQRVRERTEELYQSREELLLLHLAIDQSSVGMVMLDERFRVEDMNPAFAEMLGRHAGEWREHDLLETIWSSRNPAGMLEQVRARLVEGHAWRGEFVAEDARGAEIWLSGVATPVCDRKGRRHYLLTLDDVTERKRYEQQLLRQANYDALTGLPNRILGMDRLHRALVYGRRRGRVTAVMFVDLDRFKEINDTLGHRVGDLLLMEAASRLEGCVRAEDTVARLGGDEFLVVLQGKTDVRPMESVAEKILTALSRPFEIEGRELRLGASIGIAVAPQDSDDPETLLRYADTAMYRAKQAGRNCFRYYTRSMNEEAMERLRIDQALHGALERSEFSLYLQPIVDARSRSVRGAEALLRWRSAELGAVPPDRFIPVAEENGLIVPIGCWVLREACRIASRMPSGFVAVNVAFAQFRDEGFVEAVRSALKSSGLEPSRLHLEITERVMMPDLEEVRARIDELHRMGVVFAIDDFGTGYSSLGYLGRFPCRVLKIDRGFVEGIHEGGEPSALVDAIIGLGHALHLEIVAEGVETAEQAAELAKRGCDFLQGWYFARPLSEDAFLALQAHGVPLPWQMAGGMPVHGQGT